MPGGWHFFGQFPTRTGGARSTLVFGEGLEARSDEDQQEQEGWQVDAADPEPCQTRSAAFLSPWGKSQP